MSTAIWSPLAELELEEILYFIAFDCGRPATADRIGCEIRDGVDDHLRRGRQGHLHPHLPPEWRYLKRKRWLIAYEPTSDGLTVHRIVDAVRDLDSFFKRDR
jgi:plasmid stabilization system protein ParE